MSLETKIDLLTTALYAVAESGGAIANAINDQTAYMQSQGISHAPAELSINRAALASLQETTATIKGAVSEALNEESTAAQETTAADTQETTAADTQETTADTEPFSTPQDSADSNEAPLTLENVKQELVTAVQSHGKAAVAKLLEKHGATRLPDLAKSSYPQFVADCRAL